MFIGFFTATIPQAAIPKVTPPTSRTVKRLPCLMLLIGGCLCGAALSGAEPPKSETAAGPLTYRRVFVPADQIDQWPHGAARYVPVKAAEVQRLLVAAAERADDAGAPAAGRIAAARYTARLQSDGLLTGEMQLDVQHDAHDDLLVPLAPCGVALSQPEWIAPPKNKPAVLGVDQEGMLRLVVSRPGTLRADWTLRGQLAASGEWGFRLALPTAASSRLQLELPRAMTPWIELGTVTELPSASKDHRNWQVEIGRRTATQLWLVPAAAEQGMPRAVVRQNLVYDFSPRGLELNSRLTLDLGPRPLDHLTLELGAGLHLLDARMGDVALTWSRRPSRPHQPEQVALEFPEPLTGASRVVQIRAVAPLPLGERMTLPALSPREVFWQEAAVTLLVPRPLVIQELNLSGCRQSKVESLAGVKGQSLALQCYDPDARIEVRVDRPEPPLSIAAAASLELTPRETRGRWVADCAVAESERFGMSALVMPGWRIEHVETEPVGGLEHWGTVQRGGRTHLEIFFAHAIAEKAPLRVVVTGRLSESALARPISQGVLRMIEVEGATQQQMLIGIDAAKPHQLHVRGDEDLTRIDLSKLDSRAKARFGSATPDLVYRDNHGANRLQTSLVRQAAGHAADIQMTLHVRGGAIEETARIACRPDSGGMDRLLVHASQVRPQAFQWSLMGDETVRLATRRLSDAQQREAGYASGETWEIVLDRIRTAPFELIARRTLSWPAPLEATLMAVSPMAEQHGMLTVRSEAGEPVRVDNLRLLPIPSESAPPDGLNTARASYRYDPERDAVLPQSMLLIAHPQAGALSPGALAWKARYEARCNADGRTNHQVVVQVENAGRRQIRVDFPPGASLQRVTVDGKPVRRDAAESRTGAVVELSPERRFQTIGLDYLSQDSRWGVWTRLTPILPTFDIEVLRWEGVLWTPPDYRILGADSKDGLAQGWRSRLAGPLARRPAEPLFNPLEGADWRGLVGPTPATVEARRRIELLIGELAERQPPRGETLRLGAWLSPTMPRSLKSAAPLLIDAAALAEAGITPGTIVPEVASADPRQQVRNQLSACRLALLAVDEGLLITSAHDAALRQSGIVPLDDSTTGMLLTALPIAASDPDVAAAGRAEHAIIDAQQWVRQAVDAQLPWLAIADSTTSDDALTDRAWHGWTAHRTSIDGASAPAVIVVRQPLWLAAGWSIFLLTALGLWWLYPRSFRGWSLLLGMLALAALLAPAWLAPALTTVFLAAAVAALVTALVPAGPRWPTAAELGQPARVWESRSGAAIPSTLTQVAADSQARRRAAATAGSSVRRGLLIWFLLFLAMPTQMALRADDPRAPRADIPQPGGPPAAPVHTILVPIDKLRQPSGDTWYVPLEFYKELGRRSAARAVERHGWLTTGVQYRGRLEWDVAQTRLQMSQWKAAYDVEVFGRQSQIRLPLGRQSVTLMPAGATLDGRAVEPVWDHQGQGLLIEVSEPGRHRVELLLTPLSPEAEAAGIEILTPPLPLATVELSLPAGAAGVEVPSALGSVETLADPPRMTAQLGGTDKLRIRWPQPSAQGEENCQVEQLLWLKIAPGAVTLDARLKLFGFEGRRQKIQVQIDSCLRLLSAKSAVGEPLETRILPGAPQTIVLETAHGFAADEEVSLALLWVDASGLGQLRLPRVAPVQAAVVNTSLAVVVDKTLTYQAPRETNLVTVTPAELAAQWPIGRTAPDLAYRLPRAAASWSIATAPRASQTTAEQTLALSLAANSAEFRYAALLETMAGSRFQYRLRLPKGLVVTQANLTQQPDEVDRVERWSQLDGVLTIFLTQPLTGKQRLTLQGNWPLPGDQVPSPQFHLEDCRQQSLDLAIYRPPGVDVQPTDAEAVHELTEPTTELLRLADRLPGWFGRPLGNYRLVNLAATTIFSIRPAPAQAEATQITTLSRQEGVWRAAVDFRLRVRDGAVDTIRFQLPPSLRGALTITPEEPFSVVEIPGQRQRQLVIRPREAVRDDLRLNISGALVFAAGQRVAAPLVEPMDLPQVAHYLVLPKQVEQERVEWELRGLERKELPHDDDSPPLASQSVNTYHVMGSRFQAALASVEKIERAPRIRLADVRLALDEAGLGSGIATFDIEPAGLWQCVLDSPPGVRSVRATVGALPTALTPLEENKWELSLISNQLPQRIEILFEGQVRGRGSEPLKVPWIAARGGPMEVAQTLWTVYAPRGTSLAAKQASGAPTTALGQQWQRLDSMTATLGEASSDESAEILARWYEPWAFDLHDTWRTIGRKRSSSTAEADAIAARLHENRRQHELIAQRLRTLDVLDRAVHATTPAQPGTALWRWSRPEGNPKPLRVSAAGPLPVLQVESRSVLSSDLTARILLAALLCAAIGLLLWPRLRTPIAAWAWRLRYILAVLGGGLAWLLLSPGLWGLVLAVLAVAAAWRLGGDRSYDKRISGERLPGEQRA